MIPYFQQPSLHMFGPVTIHAFGFLVAMAVIVGSKLALMRCESRELDPEVCADLIYYALFAGFLVAHVYSVLAVFVAAFYALRRNAAVPRLLSG